MYTSATNLGFSVQEEIETVSARGQERGRTAEPAGDEDGHGDDRGCMPKAKWESISGEREV